MASLRSALKWLTTLTGLALVASAVATAVAVVEPDARWLALPGLGVFVLIVAREADAGATRTRDIRADLTVVVDAVRADLTAAVDAVRADLTAAVDAVRLTSPPQLMRSVPTSRVDSTLRLVKRVPA